MRDVRQVVAEKRERWKLMAMEYRCILKPSLIMFAVYALAISAILRANINYLDDARRVFKGGGRWYVFGRYISDFLSVFIHTDSYLTDVSPLPQLLAAFLMALAAAIVWYVVSDNKKFSFWDLAALVPFALCPYFLQCFSYKYDAPYMALSVLCAVMPLLFWKSGYKGYFAAVVIGTLGVCLTYQASSGIFPMLVVMLCLKKWNGEESIQEILKFILYSSGGYVFGMLFYKIFLMPEKDTYVSTAIPGIHNIISVAGGNFAKYFHLVRENFRMLWLLLIFLMCLAFLFVAVRDARRKWYVSLLVSIIALLSMCLLSFGVYPLFMRPLFVPRAMYGFGIFLAFVGIAVSTAKKAYPAKMVCFALGWCFFVFSFTYGNALKEQQSYEEMRIAAVINDLNGLEIMVGDDKKEVQLKGGVGYAPIVKNMVKHNPMIKSLVPIQFKSGFKVDEYKFFHHYGIKKMGWNWAQKSGKDFNDYNLPIVKDTMYHTIRGKDGCVLIELK